MSFSFSFTASSIAVARQNVHEAYAPAAVKALIEKCLDALSHPLASQGTPHGAGVSTQDTAKMSSAGQAQRPPRFMGVHVEAWGHIADPGDHGRSSIEKFVVQPLFE